MKDQKILKHIEIELTVNMISHVNVPKDQMTKEMLKELSKHSYSITESGKNYKIVYSPRAK